MPNPRLALREDGFVAIEGFLSLREVKQTKKNLSEYSEIAGSRRLLDSEWCRDLAICVKDRISGLGLICGGTAVLCTYFNKSATTNWAVAPHRDLAIPVSTAFMHTGWKHWSTKEKIPHVQPPLQVLSQLLSVRLNLDVTSPANGAIKVAPGSHLDVGGANPSFVCAGSQGSALIMRPLLSHSSSKSSSGQARRVLQFLLAPSNLPPPAQWYYSV